MCQTRRVCNNLLICPKNLLCCFVCKNLAILFNNLQIFLLVNHKNSVKDYPMVLIGWETWLRQKPTGAILVYVDFIWTVISFFRVFIITLFLIFSWPFVWLIKVEWLKMLTTNLGEKQKPAPTDLVTVSILGIRFASAFTNNLTEPDDSDSNLGSNLEGLAWTPVMNFLSFEFPFSFIYMQE